MTVDNASSSVIPTIDIAPYLADPSSPEALSIVNQVRDACMNTGFFSLVGHGISKELQEQVFSASKTFFALPLEEKKKCVAPPLLNRGYELIGTQVLQEGTLPDLKEVCHTCSSIEITNGHFTDSSRVTTSVSTSPTLRKKPRITRNGWVRTSSRRHPSSLTPS